MQRKENPKPQTDTERERERERERKRILSSQIPWWIWQKQSLMNLYLPSKKTNKWLHLSSNHVKQVVFRFQIWRQICPHSLKNPKPTFQSTYLSISILVFIHYWGKEFFWEKVLVLLARLAHLLGVSIKPSLLWIVDPINLLFWNCELEIMILKFFSFSFFFFELWVRTYNFQEWACIFFIWSCDVGVMIFESGFVFFIWSCVSLQLWSKEGLRKLKTKLAIWLQIIKY